MALPPTPFDWCGALTRAQVHAGLKDDSVASLMGLTRQRYAQMRSGAANLSMPHVFELAKDRDGMVMLRAFLAEVELAFGVGSVDMVREFLTDAIDRYKRTLIGRMRMAKAQLPATAAQRRTA